MPDIFEEFSRTAPEVSGYLKKQGQKAALGAAGAVAALPVIAAGYDPREVAQDAKQLAMDLKQQYIEPVREMLPENVRLGVSGLLSDPSVQARYSGGMGLNIPGLTTEGMLRASPAGVQDYYASVAYEPPAVPGARVGFDTGMGGQSNVYGSYNTPVMGGNLSAQVSSPFSTSHVGDMLKNFSASLRFTGKF